MNTIRFVWIFVAITMAIGSASVAGETDPPELGEARPKIALIEYDPWARLIGADPPIFALYENGRVIFQTLDDAAPRDGAVHLKTAEAQLSPLEASELIDYVARRIENLSGGYTLTDVTDQPTWRLYVWLPEGRKTVTIYGDLRSGWFLRFLIPQDLRQIIDRLAAFAHDSAPVWRPGEIELLLRRPQAGEIVPDPGPWPPEWMTYVDNRAWRRPSGGVSIYLPTAVVTMGELHAFLKRLDLEKRPVRFDGESWWVSYRLPFPSDRAWTVARQQ